MHASYSSTFSCRTVNFLKEHNHVFAHVREFDFFMDRCHDNHEFKDEGTLYQVFFAQVYTMCESLITHLIIQQIVTLSKYGHDALDIRHP